MDTGQIAYRKMFETYGNLHPKLMAENKMKWLMPLDTYLALLKMRPPVGHSNSALVVTPDMSITFLGIPLEVTETDEINLVIKVA